MANKMTKSLEKMTNFCENWGETFGYDITESHPMWSAYQIWCEMRDDESDDESDDEDEDQRGADEALAHPPYYCDGGCGKKMGEGNDECKRICEDCEDEEDNCCTECDERNCISKYGRQCCVCAEELSCYNYSQYCVICEEPMCDNCDDGERKDKDGFAECEECYDDPIRNLVLVQGRE